VNVGEIRMVDDTIGKIISITANSVIFVCLKFPYFRSMRPDDASKFKRLGATLEDFQSMLDLPSSNTWTLAAWKAEINRITDLVIEDYQDQEDDFDEDSSTADNILKNIIKTHVLDSDWTNDSQGQEKIIQYSINYLDVSPTLIMRFVGADNSHRWQAVRKGSAVAHLMLDIYKNTKKKLSNSLSE